MIQQHVCTRSVIECTNMIELNHLLDDLATGWSSSGTTWIYLNLFQFFETGNLILVVQKARLLLLMGSAYFWYVCQVAKSFSGVIRYTCSILPLVFARLARLRKRHRLLASIHNCGFAKPRRRLPLLILNAIAWKTGVSKLDVSGSRCSKHKKYHASVASLCLDWIILSTTPVRPKTQGCHHSRICCASFIRCWHRSVL